MTDDTKDGGYGQSQISLVLTHVVILDNVWQSPATCSEGVVDFSSANKRRVLRLDSFEHDTKYVYPLQFGSPSLLDQEASQTVEYKDQSSFKIGSRRPLRSSKAKK